MMNKTPCRKCGHRADYHHQPAPHACGLCECAGVDLAILEKPREVGVGVTPDKFVLPIFVAGTRPVICFGCGGHIEPGTTFLKRLYSADSSSQTWFTMSKKRVPFCSTCCPFVAEGVRS